MRLLLLLITANAAAIEPWADTALPAKDGLEVWLDAAAQPAAFAARKIPLDANGAMSLWLDGSGGRRDVRQPLLEMRPRLITSAGASFVRFDGKDDFLSAAPGVAMDAATVFVVAAPRANPGMFRGFLALNRAGENDYTTGLNLDLGGAATPTLTRINAEGAGAGGERNLLKTQFDFGTFHVFTLTADTALSLRLDGADEGTRPRMPGAIAMDELTVGGRCYSNDGHPAYAASFIEADIAEIIIYRRALPAAERDAVEKYLMQKHSGLRSGAATGFAPLIPVKDPPPVQMLVPGFEVRELPLKLTNIDCLRYRHDGVLVAGAYDGKIRLLRDTDGDGSEDKADLYWQSDDLKNVIGMALTPKGDPRGDGVFVATAGRILFISDKDHDDRGDEQIVVASGWEKQATPGGGGSVDALGLALAPDGSIYFGLGVSAYNNAYELDADGKAHYRLESERGTVQRVSPDFSKRETICTGIRYPVGAAFNEHGDLFMTEQEGATWLANGNPFDELVHIEKGRHYGFPPRHPKHLPNVIDEPSVFDYGPQHQSTCGFAFNVGQAASLPNGATTQFGPAWWKNDAIVTGESRGKLYRTKLVKTATGYVAQNQLIACLSMLTIDCAVSPRGDLIVACHSGGPDWGSGPGGEGKLFRISAAKEPVPRPVATYFANPGELRLTFDTTLDPTTLRDLAEKTEITAGRYVAAGDRFESFRPGYQVVKDQMATPRRAIPVLGVSLSADQRTITLAVPPQTAAEHYAVALPDFTPRHSEDTNPAPADASGRVGVPPAGSRVSRGPSNPNNASEASKDRREDASIGGRDAHPAQTRHIDVATDMCGVEALWVSADGKERWHGWLPHLDLAVAEELTKGSSEHARLWELVKRPGRLGLKGQLDLWEMLQPAIQPGAILDHERPLETVSVSVRSNLPIMNAERISDLPNRGVTVVQKAALLYQGESNPGGFVSFQFGLATGDGKPTLRTDWTTAADPRPRAFPVRRFLMPFAKPADANAVEVARAPLEGNWLAGRRLYFGRALCGTCHQMSGEGGRVGPDLSNLAHRDLASVERDIREPSAALNPDHLSYHITLKDGAELVAVVLTEDADTLRIGEANGAVRDLPRASVREVKALPTSLMPPGLLDALSETERKDLMAFLLSPAPLLPTPIEAKGPPPPRKRAELEAVLKGSEKWTVDSQQSALRVLLVSAKKDHGPGEHDYPLFQKRWSTLLGLTEGVEVATAQDWPSVEQLAKADVAVFYSNNPAWNPERKAELDAFLQRGGGAVFIHWAIEGREFAPELADCIGLASNSGKLKFRHGAITMTFPNAEHPITRGFATTDFVDETYWQAVGDPSRITLLGEVVEDGAPRPQLWAREHGKGRVFVSIPGHYMWTFDDPLHRVLLLRGICWAARQPVDRLSELATIGARISE